MNKYKLLKTTACTIRSGGGHSHMSVDIKCLSIDPLFYADPTPNDPLFLFSPHPMTPFFNFFSQILHRNCKFLHTEWPPFLGVQTKKASIFLVPTPNDPFFRRNLTLNAPYIRSPVGTCTSLSYLSAPPPGIRYVTESWGWWGKCLCFSPSEDYQCYWYWRTISTIYSSPFEFWIYCNRVSRRSHTLRDFYLAVPSFA